MTIVWTPDAKQSYEQNIAYLADEWDDAVIENFINKLEEAIFYIRKIRHFIHSTINERKSAGV